MEREELFARAWEIASRARRDGFWNNETALEFVRMAEEGRLTEEELEKWELERLTKDTA